MKFLRKRRIPGEPEGPETIWRRPALSPDHPNHGPGRAHPFRHRPKRPVPRSAARRSMRAFQDFPHLAGTRRLPRRQSDVPARNTLIRKALLPAPDGGLRYPDPPRDLRRSATIRTRRNDLYSPDMLQLRTGFLNNRFQPTTILFVDPDFRSFTHGRMRASIM